MDVNEDIYCKSSGRALAMSEYLQIIEAVGNYTGTKIGARFFKGTKPIDGVWVTSGAFIIGACVMPAGYWIVDHRLFVLEFLMSSLIGHDPPKILRAEARRLNTNIPSGELYYINRLEELIKKHKIVQRVVQAHENTTLKASLKIKLDNIYEEQKYYMIHVEKKCRRIKSGLIPFSPYSSKWIRRAQVYRSILRFHIGVWVTFDVFMIRACVMPAGYGIGDHRLFCVVLSNVVLDRA